MSELCPNYVRGKIETAIGSVVATAISSRTKQAYAAELGRFLSWFSAADRSALTFAVATEYIGHLDQLNAGQSTINIALAALTKLAAVMAAHGAATGDTAYLIASMPRRGRSASPDRSLTKEQAFALVSAPNTAKARGVRDRAVLAVLVGCGLTVSQCSSLTVEQLDGNKILGLRGRGASVHEATMPDWVSEAVNEWLKKSGIKGGSVFVNAGGGKRTGIGVDDSQIQRLVSKYAKQVGIHVSPRDLAKSSAAFSDPDFDDYKARIAALERETVSLRRALALKSNLPHDKLKEVVIQYSE